MSTVRTFKEKTYGGPVEGNSSKASSTACARFNIDTDLRLRSTGAMRRHIGQVPQFEFDPRKFFL